jgi:2-methylcitrate dehydratase PrpD
VDVSFTLARNVVNVNYSDLPADAIDMTKKDILDVLGTSLAGSIAPAVAETAGLIMEFGGKPESTIIGFDCRVPSPAAALVNVTMGHAMDYDDTHDVAGLHAAISVVPAAFAIAQRKGGISGKQFITAVALGIDLICRLGLASKLSLKQSGWVYTSIYGYYGAAAASGKILGLDEAKMVNAFGIAFSQSAGGFQTIDDAALTKRMQPGFAARGGVMAALLAERGITGARNIFEGDYGVFHVYQRDQYDAPALIANLGKFFEVSNISFKPYPTCRGTHASIEATISLVIENDIKPGDVESIDIYTGDHTQLQFHPLERKRNPESIPDAQLNIPFPVGMAVARRRVTPGDFTLESIKDPEILRVSNKVTPHMLPELSRHAMEPAIVDIMLKNGKVFSKRVDYPKGSPESPMTMDEIVSKFKDCAAYARKKFSGKLVEEIVQRVRNLEECKDVSEIITLLG